MTEVERFTPEYIKQQLSRLLDRKDSKIKILQKGGINAAGHSWDDITRINFALKRISSGQYGLCSSCGSPIKLERLSIIPETPFCSSCQGEIESNRKSKSRAASA